MKPKLIKTEAEHEEALARVNALLSARPGSAAGDALELWVHLVEVYEDEHHPVPPPDPVEAIRFRMEQAELKPADLIPLIGSKSKVSEVLRGKRPLSSGMMRRLHRGLGIPADVLLGPQDARPSRPVPAPTPRRGSWAGGRPQPHYPRSPQREPPQR